MDTCKTRKRLALAITAALLLPGMAVAQTAKERELETRIAQLEAQVQALLAAQQQQQASIVQTQTTLDAVRVAQTAPSDGKPKSQPSPPKPAWSHSASMRAMSRRTPSDGVKPA